MWYRRSARLLCAFNNTVIESVWTSWIYCAFCYIHLTWENLTRKCSQFFTVKQCKIKVIWDLCDVRVWFNWKNKPTYFMFFSFFKKQWSNPALTVLPNTLVTCCDWYFYVPIIEIISSVISCLAHLFVLCTLTGCMYGVQLQNPDSHSPSHSFGCRRLNMPTCERRCECLSTTRAHECIQRRF